MHRSQRLSRAVQSRRLRHLASGNRLYSGRLYLRVQEGPVPPRRVQERRICGGRAGAVRKIGKQKTFNRLTKKTGRAERFPTPAGSRWNLSALPVYSYLFLHLFNRFRLQRNVYIIPIPPAPPGTAGVSSLMFATTDSVVSSVEATLVAF